MKRILVKIVPWLLPVFVFLGSVPVILIDWPDITQVLPISIFVLINSPYVIQGFPIALVAVYAGLIYVYISYCQDQDLIDHYIESIYFIGFLFTLVAVFFIFLNFNIDGSANFESDLPLINEVIGLIGMATGTTIVGLVARNIVKGLYIAKSQNQKAAEVVVEIKELIQSAQEFTKVYGGVLNVINEYLITRKEEITDLSIKERAYANSLEHFSRRVDQFCNELKNQQQTMQSFLLKHQEVVNSSSKELATFGQNVREVTDLFKQARSRLDLANISKDVEIFSNEIHSLEEALDDFVVILEQKIVHLKN